MKFTTKCYFFFKFSFSIKFNEISSDPVLRFFNTENVSQMVRLLKVSFRVVISLTHTFACVSIGCLYLCRTSRIKHFYRLRWFRLCLYATINECVRAKGTRVLQSGKIRCFSETIRWG